MSYRLDRLSVLVVDDNRYMLSLLSEILRGFGIRELVVLTDAATAFQEIKSTAADVVITDHVMSPISGIEFVTMLRTSDDVWVQHLEAMDSLRESVQLRAYGQRDPLVEYKIESQSMFGRLLETVRFRAASVIFHARTMHAADHKNIRESRPEVAQGEQQPAHGHDVTPEHNAEPASSGPKIGRNDPCFCGSGKKYKKCGLLETDEHKQNMASK